MQRFARFLLFCCAGLGLTVSGNSAAIPPRNDDLLAHYHFIGSDSLGRNTNAAKLKQIWSLPISREFGQKTIQKLARSIAEIHAGGVSGSTMNTAEMLRPLLEDLFQAESIGELRRRTNSNLELV